MSNALYERVTARIVEHLEHGVKIWERPWKSGLSSGVALIPMNAATKRPYSGINILCLWDAADTLGYPTHGWMTLIQARKFNARVRKGEKASRIIFTDTAEKKVEGEETTKKVRFLVEKWVFNLAQFDGLPDDLTVSNEAWPEEVRLDTLRAILKGSEVPVTWGGDKAAYNRKADSITMPSYGSFESDDAFCSTLAHELSHSSGHEKRLNRTFGKRFGDSEYAVEELVAELSAAFVCAHIGYQHERDSAAYIDHWLKILKKDSRAIFTIASHASRAADWLRERPYVVTDETAAVERQAAE